MVVNADNEITPLSSEQKKALTFVLTLLLLIISPFLLGFSFGTVDPGFMALDWNKNTPDLDTTSLFKQGRHFIGLG